MSIFFPEDEGREVPEVDYQPILRTELVTGAAGPTGSQGQKGDTGNTGAGVVTGGLTGQVLAKKSNADYDTHWVIGGGGGGAAIWGGITGTLSNQTDLQTVLDSKLSSVTWGSITGTLANQTDLQTVLDAKALKTTAITAGTGLTGGGDFSQSRTISMLADVPADSLNFNIAATEANAVGKMFWNATEGAPQVGLAGGNLQLQMGSMLVAYVRNAEATTLNKGEVVYLFGATGNRASVKRASNAADASSSKTIGIVAESIGANQNGFIITQGVLDGLSLGSPFQEGDSIYLGNTPGTFTRVKPTQPNHIVFIGVVERANAGNGQLYIRPQNGFELEELHDVLVTSPQNNQTILWNSAVTLWTNQTITIGTISGLSSNLSGKVTAVGAISPVVSSGGTTPTISIPVATASTSGYLSSIDWTTFNSKQAGGTYLTSITATAPILSTGGTSPTISIPVATATTSGYLSSTDWAAFNSKQAGGTYVTSVTGTAPIVSSGGTTPAISMPVATAATSGYISSTDWSTFNAKAKTCDVQIFTRGTLFTTTATAFTSGSPTITVASNANMVVGMAISAPFLPAQFSGVQTTITNIAGTTITLSSNATYNYSDRNIATTIHFASNTYTWTKPTGARSVDVLCIAGGGGGSSGRVNAGVSGGGGGAGGGLTFRTQLPASLLSSTESIIVGIEGVGGTGTNQVNSQNIWGGDGFHTYFGAISGNALNPWVYAAGGGGGNGNNGNAGTASSRNVNPSGGGGAGGSTAVGSGGGSALISGAGAGGGGGANSTSFFNGGPGQWVLGNNLIGGISTSSGVEGANGSNGTSMNSYLHCGGGGSGGVGAYTKSAGAGGSGGLYGGGGGGGGCQGTVNAALFSGAGGNGAQGIVIVTTYF